MMRKGNANRAVEYALLGLLALLWGASYLFIKIAVSEIPPITLIAFRVSVAALFLWGIMTISGLVFPRDFYTWRNLLVQSLFNCIGAWTILAWGQQYVDSGLASVLNSTTPIFVFFITYFVTQHEPVGRLRLIGALVGLFGVVLLVGADVLTGVGEHALGQAAVTLGAVLYAFAAIYGKRFGHLSPAVTATCTMIWGAVFLVPLSLIVDQPWTLRPSGKSIMSAIALSVFCTALALMIYFRLVRTLGSLGVTSQAYLRAVVGVALGITVLGEQLSLAVCIGLVAAIMGVVALNYPVQGVKLNESGRK